MGNTYSQIYMHFTFSTKERAGLIRPDIQPRLHAYIAKTINEEFGFAKKVGGTDDHIHILADLKRTTCPDRIMQVVKSHASKWMKDEGRVGDFSWQEGYGVFSVSASVCPKVERYIGNQAVRHRRLSFADEFKLLLERHGIEYDPAYLR